MSGRPSFFAELKRRDVWRVAIAYTVTAWLQQQLGAIVFPVDPIRNDPRFKAVLKKMGLPYTPKNLSPMCAACAK